MAKKEDGAKDSRRKTTGTTRSGLGEQRVGVADFELAASLDI